MEVARKIEIVPFKKPALVKGNASVDFSDRGLSDREAAEVVEANLGFKTKKFKLSGNEVGVLTVRTILKILQVFVSRQKTVSLKKLDLRNNSFPKSQHSEIRELVAEITALMASGKTKAGNGVLYTEGNNGIGDTRSTLFGTWLLPKCLAM